MKKQELENLTIGSIVKTKGAEYTVTGLQIEEETVVGFILDDVKKASLNTMKRNYTLVKLAEETKEESEPETTEQVTMDKVLPTIEEIEAVASKIVIADIDEPEVQPVKLVQTKKTKKTKKVDKAKAEQKAEIQKFNNELLQEVYDVEGNGILVEQKKGRIAIKFKAIEDSKPRVIIDLVMNSKGAKVHVRREAMTSIFEYLNSKLLTKDLPEKWALDLEVSIPSKEIFWEVYDKARNFEVDRMVARREAKEQKKNNK